MAETKTDHLLAQAYAVLAKAAARRKIYSRRAAKEGRPEVAHFLRAMAASEAVQARRLFNGLIGRIDKSDSYLATVFEQELQDILASYTELLQESTGTRPALLHAISQLRAAAIRLRSFYSPDSRDVKVENRAAYSVCKFCGYLSSGTPPDKCPICTADREAFLGVL